MSSSRLPNGFRLAAAVMAAALMFPYVAKTAGYAMKIEFTGYTGRAETLTNFPALIILSNNVDGSGFNFVSAPFLSEQGHDLRFIDADMKTGLNYEIERWDPGDAAYVWVQVPEIPPDGSGCIWAFWGSDDTQLPCTTNGAVWSQGYVGVWHLNESGGTHADATVENNNGVIRNDVKQDAKGLVGGANRFPGGRDDRVEVDGTAYSFEFADKSYAISAWIKPDTLGGQVAIVDNYYNSRELKIGLRFLLEGSRLRLRHQAARNGWGPRSDPGSIVVDQWQHVVGIVNRRSAKLFINGKEAATTAIDSHRDAYAQAKEPIAFGGRTPGSGSSIKGFKGMMDEVRWSDDIWSADWIWADYMTAASNTVFTDYGTPVKLGADKTLSIPLPASDPPPVADELRGGSSRGKTDTRVVPVKWERFKQTPARDPDAVQCGKILLNSARYNAARMPGVVEQIESRGRKLTGRDAHDIIRPANKKVFGMAVVLKTGLFDEKEVGVSREEALARTSRLIKTSLDYHGRKTWNYPWQGASWAADLGLAAWILWDELDADTREAAREMVEYEADRFLHYRVPYWNGRGGDSKAEENAWNAKLLQVAVAMMPDHPNVYRWRRIASELMVSAFSTKKDMESTEVLDGRPVWKWLNGYNVREDGVVINHNRAHPDYMCAVKLNLFSFPVQSLSGQIVSETADFNADLIYRTLVEEKLGKEDRTIYQPGKPELYYPEGTDWSPLRFDNYYTHDVHAHLLGLDQGLSHSAASWMRIRARKILEMQSRRPDGRMFVGNEFGKGKTKEGDAFARFAYAYLHFWLHEQNAVSPRGNWLKLEGDRN